MKNAFSANRQASMKKGRRASCAIPETSRRLVRETGEQVLAAGDYCFQWDGRTADGLPVPSGVYLVKIQAKKLVDNTTRIVLIK